MKIRLLLLWVVCTNVVAWNALLGQTEDILEQARLKIRQNVFEFVVFTAGSIISSWGWWGRGGRVQAVRGRG